MFHEPLTVHAPVVTVIVPDTPPVIVTVVAMTVEAFAVRTPALLMTIGPVVKAKSAVANVPVTESVLVTTTALAIVDVPAEMVKSSNVLSVESNVMVAVALNVTIPVPCVYIEPAPDVFHEPLTVHAPVVTVIVPDVPPVIVTVVAVTVEAFAVRTPPLLMTIGPVVKAKSAVANVPVTESVLVTTTALAIVDVPAEMVKSSNVLSVESNVMVAVALNVTIPVPCVYIEPAPDVFHEPLTVHAPVVTVIVPDVPPVIVTVVAVTVEAFAVRTPPLLMTIGPVVKARSAVASVLVTERVFVTTTALAIVAVPAEMVKSSNVLSVESSVMVAVASNVWMPVPCVNTELAPDEFQLPETVHAPVVIVSVPDVPPVIVNVEMMTVDAFAVRVPPFPIEMSGVSAIAPMAKSAVANAVVDDASVTESVVSQRMPRVAIVNVCAVPADDVNVTELNSASPRLAPAKVNVPPVAESNVTVPVPASQEAVVVAFVHVPLNRWPVDDPKEI